MNTETKPAGNIKSDTKTHGYFYENDLYPLSSFSSFCLYWKNRLFHTLEHAYHYEKFCSNGDTDSMWVAEAIFTAPSAHTAFQLAQKYKVRCRPDWDDVKVKVMYELIRHKTNQHEYVRKKLVESYPKKLVEDSWRDDFWGWGPNRDGVNQLGQLWEKVRDELVALKTLYGLTKFDTPKCSGDMVRPATKWLRDSTRQERDYPYSWVDGPKDLECPHCQRLFTSANLYQTICRVCAGPLILEISNG